LNPSWLIIYFLFGNNKRSTILDESIYQKIPAAKSHKFYTAIMTKGATRGMIAVLNSDS